MDLGLPTVDPYKLLGVNPKVGQDEIKKAYKALARQLHPDKNKSANAEERFKELSAAYELIKDPDARRSYDHLREAEKEKSTADANRRTGATFDSFPRSNTQWYSHATPGTSSHSSYSTRRPNGGTFTGFRMSFNPGATAFSFVFDDDLNDSFSAFFRNSSSGAADSASRTNFFQPYARKRHTTSDFIPDPTHSPSSTGGAASTLGAASWYDKFLSDQLNDVSRLLNQLFEGTAYGSGDNERKAMRRAQSEARMKEDGGTMHDAASNWKLRQRKKEASLFDDMYDWSVPMFDHSVRNKQKSGNVIDDVDSDVENKQEDMTRIRFPCIYCGRKLNCQDLTKHEEVCKRFYTADNTTTRAATTANGAATGSATTSKGSSTRATVGSETSVPNISNNSNLGGRPGYESGRVGYDSGRTGFESGRNRYESGRSGYEFGSSGGLLRERSGGMDDKEKWNADDPPKWKTDELSSSRKKKCSTEKTDNISCPWCRRVFNQVSFDSHLMICNVRRNHLNDPTRYPSSRFSSTYAGKQSQSRTVPPAAAAGTTIGASVGSSSVRGTSYPYRRGSTTDTSNLSATRLPTSQQRTGRSTATHAGLNRAASGSIPRAAYSSTERLRRFNYNF